MTGLLARRTDPAKVDVVVADLESVPTNIRPRHIIQSLLIDIDDVLAVQTDEVMVLMNPRVEPRR